MVGQPAVHPQGGGLNFPIALCLFSYMDAVGYFFTGKLFDTSGNIWKYMEETFGEDFSKFKKFGPEITNVFRNGLSHEYFAKHSAISRGMYEVIFFDEKEILVLDADRLSDIFIKSIYKFNQYVLKNRKDVYEKIIKIGERNEKQFKLMTSNFQK